MTEITKITRPMIAHFLNTATTGTEVFTRMGKGITGGTISYNPSVSTEQYINEDSATNSVDSYSVSQPVPQTAYIGEPIFDYIYSKLKLRAVGSLANTTVLNVFLFDKVGTTTPATFYAEKNNCTIQLDDFGGDAGSPVIINYTLLYNGDPVKGSAAINAGVATFTAGA